MTNLQSFSLAIVALIFLANLNSSLALDCIMCKESQYPQQCGEQFNPLPNTLPTIACTESCVTFKNIYDGGRNIEFLD